MSYIVELKSRFLFRNFSKLLVIMHMMKVSSCFALSPAFEEACVRKSPQDAEDLTTTE